MCAIASTKAFRYLSWKIMLVHNQRFSPQAYFGFDRVNHSNLIFKTTKNTMQDRYLCLAHTFSLSPQCLSHFFNSRSPLCTARASKSKKTDDNRRAEKPQQCQVKVTGIGWYPVLGAWRSVGVYLFNVSSDRLLDRFLDDSILSWVSKCML